MDIDIQKIKRLLSEYKNIDYAFVFGSATAKLLPESDIDILIGGCLSFLERTEIALRLEPFFNRKIDIVLADDASPEVALKAFSSGLPVEITDKNSLRSDYYKHLRQYEDNTALRKIRLAKIKRRYECGR